MSASPVFSMARRVVRSGTPLKTMRLDRRLLPPVLVVGLEHELHAGVMRTNR